MLVLRVINPKISHISQIKEFTHSFFVGRVLRTSMVKLTKNFVSDKGCTGTHLLKLRTAMGVPYTLNFQGHLC
jgi:hypothetical protein